MPVGAVEFADGAEATPDELLTYLRNESAATRCRPSLVVVDELPRTPSLKVSQPGCARVIRREAELTAAIRGAAAVVGVADEVSPSGVIDVPLRELEARVVTRGACRRGSVARAMLTGCAPVPAARSCIRWNSPNTWESATTIHRRHADRGRQLWAVCRTRRRGDRGGSGRDGRDRVCVYAAGRAQAR